MTGFRLCRTSTLTVAVPSRNYTGFPILFCTLSADTEALSFAVQLQVSVYSKSCNLSIATFFILGAQEFPVFSDKFLLLSSQSDPCILCRKARIFISPIFPGAKTDENCPGPCRKVRGMILKQIGYFWLQ